MVAEASHAGRTVFMSSHVLGEVQQTAQRVGIVRQGRLVTVERVETLRERAVREVEIHFATPVPAAEFAALPGVSDLRLNGAVLRDVVTKTLWDARRSVAG
jgi:ABC-2 type transport system ATP-binding protein